MFGRKGPIVVAVAFASVTTSCGPCFGDCDETVHHFPIQSAEYQRLHGNPLECGVGDAGHVDAGEQVTSDPICDELVSVDATTGAVTHSFTYRGKRHVVRYRRISVGAFRKSFFDF